MPSFEKKMDNDWPTGNPWESMSQWIGLGGNLQENPYFMVKTMVSCKFSLKPIHWMRTRPFLGPKNIPNRKNPMISHASTSWRRLWPVSADPTSNVNIWQMIMILFVDMSYIYIYTFVYFWGDDSPINNHHSWIFIRSMWDTQVAGHLAVLEAPPLLAEPGPKLAWLGLKTKTLLVRSWHSGHDFHWNLVKQVLKFI